MNRPPFAEIITVGNELLRGHTLNTNARFLGRELSQWGMRVQSQTACEDKRGAIGEALSIALKRSDLIVMSGGLGPTPDDVTREALADFFHVDLVLSGSQYTLIRKAYKRFTGKMPGLVKREAYFPRTAHPLINRYGIALGFYFQRGSQMIIVLPGVPGELQKMFAECVKPLLKRHFGSPRARQTLVAKMTGISEPDAMRKLGKSFFKLPMDFGIYPDISELTIRIHARNARLRGKIKKEISKRLDAHIFAWEETGLASKIGQILKHKRQTVAVAESCTGGRLASEITSTPGSSRYFLGGLVSYSNDVKKNQLGIPSQVLKTKGAVSPQVAKAMASGIRQSMGSTYGIGITGIAGPAGGRTQKPVGLVYLALASGRGTKVWKRLFFGDRRQIQDKAAKKALTYLWEEIR